MYALAPTRRRVRAACAIALPTSPARATSAVPLKSRVRWADRQIRPSRAPPRSDARRSRSLRQHHGVGPSQIASQTSEASAVWGGSSDHRLQHLRRVMTGTPARFARRSPLSGRRQVAELNSTASLRARPSPRPDLEDLLRCGSPRAFRAGDHRRLHPWSLRCCGTGMSSAFRTRKGRVVNAELDGELQARGPFSVSAGMRQGSPGDAHPLARQGSPPGPRALGAPIGTLFTISSIRRSSAARDPRIMPRPARGG